MSSNSKQLEIEKIMPVLPHRFHEKQAIPLELVGATIVAIGIIEAHDMDDNLVIEYKPIGSEKTKRIVLGFDETGMWF
jgi:hypothetical protein